MIDFLADTPGHLVAARMGGRVESRDIERFFDRLERTLDAHEQVNFFMEIESLESMSAKALLKDVQKGLGQIKNLRRIHRVAVVAEQEWIRTGAEWEDRLFSGIDLRTFEPPEREEALAWASETPPDAGPPKRGLEAIPTKDPDALAFAVAGPITGADIEAITPKLRAAYDEHSTVNLLMRMDANYRFRLDVFSERLAELKSDAFAHVERYAIVGAPVWMQSAIGFLGPLLRLDVHLFDAEDEADAWQWVGTEPAEEGPAGQLEAGT
jgi:hypothetical protein